MTAMPCGKKKRRMEMIQSQMVMPPLAAMEGTTLRLKTATTNSRTRSRRPRARTRWGWAGWVVDDIGSVPAETEADFSPAKFGMTKVVLDAEIRQMHAGRAGVPAPTQTSLLTNFPYTNLLYTSLRHTKSPHTNCPNVRPKPAGRRVPAAPWLARQRCR